MAAAIETAVAAVETIVTVIAVMRIAMRAGVDGTTIRAGIERCLAGRNSFFPPFPDCAN
jgi:hypothetical protein